jgi:hypothetical protein
MRHAKPVCLALAAIWLAGCASSRAGPSAQDRLSYPSVSADASRVLPLSSNQDNTRFTVDGKPVGTVGAGGELKVLVNDQPHTIVAKPPGYQAKKAFVQPPYDGVSTVSFYYTYKEASVDAPELPTVATSEPDDTPEPPHPQPAHPVPQPPPVAAALPDSLPAPANPASFGTFIALLIGNDKYEQARPLDTPVSDVEALETVLQSRYGFRVTVLKNATRHDILGALEKLKGSLDENSNVLIYYAGHGHLDKAENRGYWLPVDAEDKNPDNWIANDDITSKVKAMAARHVLVVADSCYSGSMTRGNAFRGLERTVPGGPESVGYLQKVAAKKSRQVLSSGGEEPVADNGGKGRHSVFASALLDELQDSGGALDGVLLFEKIRQKVGYNAEQNPEYGVIKNAGHDGGEFLFIPHK